MASVNSETRHRVKLYSFSDQLQWEDMGTGHVTVMAVERLQGITIVVRSEEDGSILLESRILSDRSYQKQEDTLISWTEEESCDLALSFQEKNGCDEVWRKICELQGRDPSVEITQTTEEDGDISEHASEEPSAVILPPCELSKLDEIFEVLTGCLSVRREPLALAIEKENYIQKLLELFKMCEDLGNLDGLHHLYNIFRTLFFLNQASLLSIMFQPQHVMDVIGCLEYNPSKYQVKHRQYLEQTSRYKDVIALNNNDLRAKIHLTYKIMYIQEVILPTPSLFEENMMSAFNSVVLFNKAEIVNTIQEDRRLLYELFTSLQSESLTNERYKELALFLRELCIFALALELEDGTKFYQRLCTFGLMSALEQMMMCEVESIVAIAVDVLNQLADYNSAILRDHILKQNDMDEDNQFLNILISLLVDSQYSDMDVQLVGLIKTLIDPDNILTDTTAQTVEKSIFLNYFYKHCMHRLMAPLMAQTSGDTVSKDTVQNAALLASLLDLLSLCVERHAYHIRNYVIEKNILGRVLVLLTSDHGHLVLSSLRFCRKIIGLKDECYLRYIVRHNLLSPVVKRFIATSTRYNLINSAVIELFEFIKSENLQTLIKYVGENFLTTLESITYIQTFKDLKLKYDQEMDRISNSRQMIAESTKGGIIHGLPMTFRRDERDLDEDEETWFDEEEAVTIDKPPPPPPPSITSLPRLTPTPSFHYSPRPSSAISKLTSSSPPKLPPALQSLVDYDEDSDEEQQNGDDSNTLANPAKRKRINNDST